MRCGVERVRCGEVEEGEWTINCTLELRPGGGVEAYRISVVAQPWDGRWEPAKSPAGGSRMQRSTSA